MDQSLTGFYRVGQKLSDVIPVLRITPRATEPSTVSVSIRIEISDCRSLLFDPPCRNPVKSVPRGKAIWNANGGLCEFY